MNTRIPPGTLARLLDQNDAREANETIQSITGARPGPHATKRGDEGTVPPATVAGCILVDDLPPDGVYPPSPALVHWFEQQMRAGKVTIGAVREHADGTLEVIR